MFTAKDLVPVVLVLVAMYLASSHAEGPQPDDCSGAPTADLREICRQLSAWDKQAARVVSKQTLGGGRRPDLHAAPTPLEEVSVFDCMDWRCVCTTAGRPLSSSGHYCFTNDKWQLTTPTLRKEYRMMSDLERAAFHAALNALKQDGSFDRMVMQHSNVSLAPGAHGGAAFLPWHREYLKRFEIALRLIDWSVSLPYWDSSLDEPLPDPAASVLWSSDFLGETDANGNVMNGPFSGWTPTDGQRRIRRTLGRAGRLFDAPTLTRIMSNVDYHSLASRRCPIYTDWESMEVEHGLVHLWVGGHMFNQQLSPNDPAFFLHHGFVDAVWEEWRRRRQTREQRPRQYTDTPCRETHAADTAMRPFMGTNLEGLTNGYTDDMFTYQPSPSCSRLAPDCGATEYLLCDTRPSVPRCVSKVQLNGACRGYEGLDICVVGECVAGRCTVVRTTTSTSTTTTVTITTGRPQPSTCFNGHPCCFHWQNAGYCTTFAPYMSTNCRSSCRHCIPNRPSTNEGCIDLHPDCPTFARQGFCDEDVYRIWMLENCHRSCQRCEQTKFDLCATS